jgi:hypothetical protein
MKFSEIKVGEHFLLNGEYCKKASPASYFSTSTPFYGEIFITPEDSVKVGLVVVPESTNGKIPDEGIVERSPDKEVLNSLGAALATLDAKFVLVESKLATIEKIGRSLATILYSEEVRKQPKLYASLNALVLHLSYTLGTPLLPKDFAPVDPQLFAEKPAKKASKKAPKKKAAPKKRPVSL